MLHILGSCSSPSLCSSVPSTNYAWVHMTQGHMSTSVVTSLCPTLFVVYTHNVLTSSDNEVMTFVYQPKIHRSSLRQVKLAQANMQTWNRHTSSSISNHKWVSDIYRRVKSKLRRPLQCFPLCLGSDPKWCLPCLSIWAAKMKMNAGYNKSLSFLLVISWPFNVTVPTWSSKLFYHSPETN